MSTATRRRRAISRRFASNVRTASSRNGSSPERTSIVNSTSCGMTLIAPGRTFNLPTVPTKPSCVSQWRSTKSTISLAAASASCRLPIGTVPAWPASPVTCTRIRVVPAIAVTTPTGKFSCSNTGPCSICDSTYATTFPSRRSSVGHPSGSPPKSINACRIVIPLSSVCSSHAGSNVPAIALLPIKAAPKCTPSSSPKATISNVYGSLRPRSCSSFTHAMAVRMPNRPS